MKPFRAWGLAATAALGAASPALADQPPRPTTLYAKLFGPAKPKVGPAASSSVSPRPPAAPSADAVATALRAEQDAWERRMSVCVKLRQVAMEANDEALLRQVDDLERQAAALYTARTSVLGLPKSVAPAIETPVDVKVAARKLTAPANPVGLDPAVRTAEARTPNDVIREVRP